MKDAMYPNLDSEFVQMVASYLSSIDYNDAYIAHFLENVNETPVPGEYVLLKFPDFEGYTPSVNAKRTQF